MKQRVYVETSVISYLASRPSRDLIAAAHQELTREWWEDRSRRFELGIAILTLTDEAVSMAEHLVGSRPIPREAAADAL